MPMIIIFFSFFFLLIFVACMIPVSQGQEVTSTGGNLSSHGSADDSDLTIYGTSSIEHDHYMGVYSHQPEQMVFD